MLASARGSMRASTPTPAAGSPTFVREEFIPPGSSGTPTPTPAPQSFRVTCRGRACPARGLAVAPRYRFTCRGGCSHPPAGLRRIPLYWWICREGACPLDGAQRAPSASRAGPLMRLFAPQGQTLFAPRFRYAQPWPHAHNPAPPRRPEGWPPYICRGGIHPSREVYGCCKLPGSSGTPTPTTALQVIKAV